MSGDLVLAAVETTKSHEALLCPEASSITHTRSEGDVPAVRRCRRQVPGVLRNRRTVEGPYRHRRIVLGVDDERRYPYIRDHP